MERKEKKYKKLNLYYSEIKQQMLQIYYNRVFLYIKAINILKKMIKTDITLLVKT